MKRLKALSLAGAMAASLFILLASMNMSFAAPMLTVDTSRPSTSTFAIGESISVTFSVTGLAAGVSETLTVNVVNESGTHISNWRSPVVGDSSGDWSASWSAPNTKLGFYRVTAQLSDGTKAAALGSRPAGYATYCIVPNPSLRTLPSEQDTRFGMQGGFNANANVLPYLGIRWILEDYSWSDFEPDFGGQFAEKLASENAQGLQYPAVNAATDSVSYGGEPWKIYTMACLNGVPDWASASDGSILPADLPLWKAYCASVAKDYSAIYSAQPQHLYQLTWEPDISMTAAEVLAIYQAAYSTIHEADPQAVVVGPTSYSIFPGQISWNSGLVGLGITSYMDEAAIHPYFTQPPGQNAVQFPEEVPGFGAPPGFQKGNLAQNAQAFQSVYDHMQVLGSEQGYNAYTSAGTSAVETSELTQAESLIRENLITLGQGFRFNIGFYIADFPTNQNYGYYYNLVSGEPFGASKIGPKPVAPAYAAQSYLLEGSTSDGPIPNLDPNEYGYIFHNGSNYVAAVWSNSTTAISVELPVGVPSVTVYDWMGNPTTLNSTDGDITLSLGEQPLYITGLTDAVLQGAVGDTALVKVESYSELLHQGKHESSQTHRKHVSKATHKTATKEAHPNKAKKMHQAVPIHKSDSTM